MSIDTPVICSGRIQEFLDLVVAEGGTKIRSLHTVAVTAAHTRNVSFATDILVPRRQSRAERATRITGSRLDPDIFEWSFAQNSSIADAIERDAAGQAKISLTSFTMNVLGHA